jgi:hypothetical protein
VFKCKSGSELFLISDATLISNQQQDKIEVVKEIDKWKRSMNQSSGNINTSELFEKKLKEKDSEIKKLSKRTEDLLSANNFTPRFTN